MEHAIHFRCGGGTKLAVSKSTIGTSDSQTQVGWEVEDLHAELDELRSRGVIIEDYDMPELKTENGVADVGFAWMAGSSTRARTPSRSCSGRVEPSSPFAVALPGARGAMEPGTTPRLVTAVAIQSASAERAGTYSVVDLGNTGPSSHRRSTSGPPPRTRAGSRRSNAPPEPSAEARICSLADPGVLGRVAWNATSVGGVRM